MSFRSPPALMTLVIAVLALVSAPRPAYACQLSRPVSPLEHLYGASAVVYGEVVTATAQGYLYAKPMPAEAMDEVSAQRERYIMMEDVELAVLPARVTALQGPLAAGLRSAPSPPSSV